MLVVKFVNCFERFDKKSNRTSEHDHTTGILYKFLCILGKKLGNCGHSNNQSSENLKIILSLLCIKCIKSCECGNQDTNRSCKRYNCNCHLSRVNRSNLAHSVRQTRKHERKNTDCNDGTSKFSRIKHGKNSYRTSKDRNCGCLFYNSIGLKAFSKAAKSAA